MDVGKKMHHYQLGGLGFEESGHIGFQKELTKQQLGMIEAVKDKEDVSNRVMSISKENTHSQYPTAKAVYDAVDGHGEFELVDSVELTEKAAILEHNLKNKYKELHIRFNIPMSDEAAAGSASTNKARFVVQTRGATEVLNYSIYNMGNQFISDYKYRWYAAFHLKVSGNYCRTDLWFGNAQMMNDGYVMNDNSGTYSGFVAPSVPMARDYIKDIRIVVMYGTMLIDENVRYLPAGTKYEIWGVRK